MGWFTIAGVAPGSYSLAACARIQDNEVYWLGQGEAQSGKALMLNLAKPLFARRAYPPAGP